MKYILTLYLHCGNQITVDNLDIGDINALANAINDKKKPWTNFHYKNGWVHVRNSSIAAFASTEDKANIN